MKECRQSVRALVTVLLLATGATAVLAVEGFDPRGKGPDYPQGANGRLTAPPTISAHRWNPRAGIPTNTSASEWVSACQRGRPRKQRLNRPQVVSFTPTAHDTSAARAASNRVSPLAGSTAVNR